MTTETERTPQAAAETAGVVAPPPLLYAGTLLLGLLLERRLPFRKTPKKARRLLGGILCIAALGLGMGAFRTMSRARTAVSPYQPSSAIVREGPYRFSRNPIYLGFTGLYVGLTLLLEARWPFLLLAPLLGVMEAGVIRREELYLARRFGADYRRYASQVRRWL